MCGKMLTVPELPPRPLRKPRTARADRGRLPIVPAACFSVAAQFGGMRTPCPTCHQPPGHPHGSSCVAAFRRGRDLRDVRRHGAGPDLLRRRPGGAAVLLIVSQSDEEPASAGCVRPREGGNEEAGVGEGRTRGTTLPDRPKANREGEGQGERETNPTSHDSSTHSRRAASTTAALPCRRLQTVALARSTSRASCNSLLLPTVDPS